MVAGSPRPAGSDRYPAALTGLLLGTALLYLWGLGTSGWANSYYAAAAQAGSESWTAFLFGSSDAAGAITIDKPPLSLWPPALAIRVFGLSPWSVLVPQAVEGVLAVWLLTASVRRTTGATWPAVLAGATLALTPVAVLMFRFNNPDALLVLLLVAAAYAVLRGVEDAATHPTRWLVLAGALVGLAFLTKMLQGLLVLPAFALVVLVAGGGALARRLVRALLAGAATVAVAGTWLALVELWPAASRPYVGGSPDDSVLELTVGHNGLSRLEGDGSTWGDPGLGRLFSDPVAGQVAWLLPAAAVLLIAGLALTARRPRTDPVRAALLLWGGWLVVTGLTFSLMAGIFHAYYTVALAPAIAALVGLGAGWLVEHRPIAATTILLTTVTSFVVLGRSDDFVPALRWVVLALGLLAAGLAVVPRQLPAVAALALVAGLAGPAAYAVQTAATPHTGVRPVAGPVERDQGAGVAPAPAAPPGVMSLSGPVITTASASAGAEGVAVADVLEADRSGATWVAATVGSVPAAGYQLATGRPVMAIGGFTGADPSPTLAEFQELVADGEVRYFIDVGRPGEITTWVGSIFAPSVIDGVTLYDLRPGVTP